MKLLAITLSIGVAHTYMAAEALQKAAKKHGIQIKVETQGSIGVEKEITPGDVAAAERHYSDKGYVDSGRGAF